MISDLFIDTLFKPGAKVNPEHKTKYIYLLAYASCVVEIKKKVKSGRYTRAGTLDSWLSAMRESCYLLALTCLVACIVVPADEANHLVLRHWSDRVINPLTVNDLLLITRWLRCSHSANNRRMGGLCLHYSIVIFGCLTKVVICLKGMKQKKNWEQSYVKVTFSCLKYNFNNIT